MHWLLVLRTLRTLHASIHSMIESRAFVGGNCISIITKIVTRTPIRIDRCTKKNLAWRAQTHADPAAVQQTVFVASVFTRVRTLFPNKQ